MTITYRLTADGEPVDVVLCTGPGCDMSTTTPLRSPWRYVVVFSRDGRLAVQLDFCSSMCMVSHAVEQTALSVRV